MQKIQNNRYEFYGCRINGKDKILLSGQFAIIYLPAEPGMPYYRPASERNNQNEFY